MQIIFATNNEHKVSEIRSALPEGMEVISLREAGIDIEIPEPHPTLEENALEKAATIYALQHTSCFSEDTGLEVAALGGAPGVKSARYAGDNSSSSQNIDKLLRELEGREQREARFRTVICLVWEGKPVYFEGTCKGSILRERRGEKGFGYDPVFVPHGSEKTFAQMEQAEKNIFSHRGKALLKLVAFLKQLKVNT